MFNTNKFNENQYNYITNNYTSFFKNKTAIDFNNWIIFPNKNCMAFDFKYLDSREVTHNYSRITDNLLNIYNIQQGKGSLIITGTLEAENRSELLGKIRDIKNKISWKQNIKIKDWWLIFYNDCIIESIKFADNYYNNTWVDFTITATYWEYMKNFYKTLIEYENIENFNFINNGLEADYFIIVQIISWSWNLHFSLNNNLINDIEVEENDFIILDSKNSDFILNWNKKTFTGIFTKLIKGENLFTITGNEINYTVEIKYNKTFN